LPRLRRSDTIGISGIILTPILAIDVDDGVNADGTDAILLDGFLVYRDGDDIACIALCDVIACLCVPLGCVLIGCVARRNGFGDEIDALDKVRAVRRDDGNGCG